MVRLSKQKIASCSGFIALVLCAGLSAGCFSTGGGKSPSNPSFSVEKKPTTSPGRDVSSDESPASAGVSRLPSLRATVPTHLKLDQKQSRVYRLRPGDPVVVSLKGIPRPEMIEDIIDEDGFVTIPYLNRVRAAERTTSELERAIRREYLQEKIYKDISVNVLLPSQSYFVRGEVRKAGRFPLVSGVTIVQAIAAAGGYTEFANMRRVKILRGGDTFEVDVKELEQRPENDQELEAGDVIVVPRSPF